MNSTFPISGLKQNKPVFFSQSVSAKNSFWATREGTQAHLTPGVFSWNFSFYPIGSNKFSGNHNNATYHKELPRREGVKEETQMGIQTQLYGRIKGKGGGQEVLDERINKR